MLSVLPITRTRSRENLSNFLSQSASARSNRLSPSYRSKPRLASRRGCPPLFLRVKAHRERGFAPEDGGGYPPSPRGVWQTIHFIGIRWYRKSGITLRARGYGLQVTGCSSRPTRATSRWLARRARWNLKERSLGLGRGRKAVKKKSSVRVWRGQSIPCC
jgi:hypothetical protein